MKSYFAYIRVSTTRQGEEGVSLQEQKSAILEYAFRRGFVITEWFEEQLSAAKRGRPVFTKMLDLLKKKKATGIVIHKIDRSARNLKDWADMADLMDRGIEVHFVHESIDLHSRTGRLSADILAVVAADYIRNLREETLKGINGRLKQGLFPFAAPMGYLNNGGGKAKTVDPERGPLIKLAFELYASREYSLHRLEEEMFNRGLRTSSGKIVRLSHLALVLRNPFYMGLIRLRNRNETFAGIHMPIIKASLYNEVQFLLDGRRSKFRQPHRHVFSCLIYCEHCHLFLVGESHKGHTYYRCHRKTCPKTCIREERFEDAILEALKRINITRDEEPILDDLVSAFQKHEPEIFQKIRRETQEELSHIQQSIKILLQKFLDNTISKELFDDGHSSLLLMRKECEEKLGKLDMDQSIHEIMKESLRALRLVCERFCTAARADMRRVVSEFIQSITTNADVIHLTLKPFMERVAGRERTKEGWEALLPFIAKELALQ